MRLIYLREHSMVAGLYRCQREQFEQVYVAVTCFEVVVKYID